MPFQGIDRKRMRIRVFFRWAQKRMTVLIEIRLLA